MAKKFTRRPSIEEIKGRMQSDTDEYIEGSNLVAAMACCPNTQEKTIEEEEISPEIAAVLEKVTQAFKQAALDFDTLIAFKSPYGWVLRDELVQEETMGEWQSLCQFGDFFLDVCPPWQAAPYMAVFRDAELFKTMISSALKELERLEPSVVGFSCLSNSYLDYGDISTYITVGTVGKALCDKSELMKLIFNTSGNRLFMLKWSTNSYNGLQAAKDDMEFRIKEVINELGAEVPSGSIGYRKVKTVSEGIENYEIAVRFDSFESIGIFHDRYMKANNPDFWEWGKVKKVGEDYLLMGNLVVRA